VEAAYAGTAAIVASQVGVVEAFAVGDELQYGIEIRVTGLTTTR